MKLYFHPVSAYSQKVLVAFYEKGIAFEPAFVDLMNPAAYAEYKKLNPVGKVPLLVADDGRIVPESSIIIEYLDQHHPGPKMLPSDPDLQRQTRFKDRFIDCYVNDPMQKVFFDAFRPEGKRDPHGVAEAHERLEAALGLLDQTLGKAQSTWAMGEDFTLADCAAAPALFYCTKVHPFAKLEHLSAYANRLFERPSYKKAMTDAAPIFAKMSAT